MRSYDFMLILEVAYDTCKHQLTRLQDWHLQQILKSPRVAVVDGRKTFVHERYMRRVTDYYNKKNSTNYRADEINWYAILGFMIDNFIPIMKILIFVIPFFV